jgi:peptidoglycan/xylan/chitin deacetylase (PgdA/CDA1 family)
MRRLKSLLKDVIYTLVRLVRPAAHEAIILAYHSFGDNDYPFTVSSAVFERQMRWLRNANFNIVSLEQIAEYRRTGSIPPATIAITIDDGYRDNFTHAFPILKSHKIPATIFITTGDMQGRVITSFPQLPKLSKEDLIELEASGLVSIEPHSVTHPRFSEISREQMEVEVRDCASFIEVLLGKKCEHFAYPKGIHDERAQEAVARAGIPYAYTTRYGAVKVHNADRALPRNGIGAATTFAEFKGIASLGRLAAPASFF